MFPSRFTGRRALLQLAVAGTAASLARAEATEPKQDAVAPSPPSAKPLEEVVIATVGYGAVGDAVRDGALLAVEQLNAAGGLLGRKVRLHPETLRLPDRDIRAQSVRIASRILAEPRLVAVIGHDGLDDALPAAIAYHRRGVLFFAPTITLSDFTRHGLDNVFATIPDSTDISTQTARIAFDIGLRRAVILRDRSTAALEIALAFRDEAAVLGITVVDERSFRAQAASPREYLAGLQGQRIDHLVIATQLDLALDLVRQATEMALPVTSVLVDFIEPEEVRARLGKVESRVMVPVLGNRAAPSPEQAAWTRAFASRFGTQPTDFAVQGADCVGVLANAASQLGSLDLEELARVLRLETAYVGLSGRMSFRTNGRIYTRLLAFASIRPDEVAYYMPGA